MFLMILNFMILERGNISNQVLINEEKALMKNITQNVLC